MRIGKLFAGLILCAVALALSGCVDHYGVKIEGGKKHHNGGTVHAPPPGKGNGPPPWAPAHGRRAKYEYRYYPSHSVYFEPTRSVWFYLDGGSWSMGASLPATIAVGSSTWVTLEMDVDKPHTHHQSVVKKYPPGQKKKKNKGKGKGKKKKY